METGRKKITKRLVIFAVLLSAILILAINWDECDWINLLRHAIKNILRNII